METKSVEKNVTQISKYITQSIKLRQGKFVESEFFLDNI